VLTAAGRGAARVREADVVRVWLIRHGQSESNAGLPSTDWRRIPLTDLGQRQAEHVAGVFAVPPRLIVSSPYLRARQTAQPTISRYPGAACEEWPVQEFSYLRPLDGQATTSHQRAPEVQAYWERADPRFSEPGAESFDGLLGRVTSFTERLSREEAGPVAVFTHGIFMRAVAWALLTGVGGPGGDSPTSDDMRRFRRFTSLYPVPNAGVLELRYYPGESAPALTGGTTFHLPASLAPQDPDERRSVSLT
jgi:2,3-bisphosphoglycerate-dependent phosphoglycerate mutase